MRELQHIADPYRQHFYLSLSPHDPHFDPMLRPQDELSSSSACSSSAQGPAPLFGSSPCLGPVVEEVFSAALLPAPCNYSESAEPSPLPLEEEVVSHPVVATSAVAHPTGERMVYNSQRRSKKAKTVVLPSEHRALTLSLRRTLHPNTPWC